MLLCLVVGQTESCGGASNFRLPPSAYNFQLITTSNYQLQASLSSNSLCLSASKGLEEKNIFYNTRP